MGLFFVREEDTELIRTRHEGRNQAEKWGRIVEARQLRLRGFKLQKVFNYS